MHNPPQYVHTQPTHTQVGAMLQCRRSLLHDAVLVLDRVMSSAVQLRPDMQLTALCSALLLVTRQAPPPGLHLAGPTARQQVCYMLVFLCQWMWLPLPTLFVGRCLWWWGEGTLLLLSHPMRKTGRVTCLLVRARLWHAY
jgi:hypothetical protein